MRKTFKGKTQREILAEAFSVLGASATHNEIQKWTLKHYGLAEFASSQCSNARTEYRATQGGAKRKTTNTPVAVDGFSYDIPVTERRVDEFITVADTAKKVGGLNNLEQIVQSLRQLQVS